jgi:hypothetical protein
VPGALQLFPAQHARPSVPQATQVPPEHSVPLAAQVFPGQQAVPCAPHERHWLAPVQTLPLPHAVPTSTHRPLGSQQPLVQVVPQHCCPVAPQVRHMPPRHAVPDAVQRLPVQQG